MARRRVALTNRNQRSVLTDMLPFEVPPTFSNRGFFRFLKEHDVEVDGAWLRWISNGPQVDAVVGLIFAIETGAEIKTETATAWGKESTRKSVHLKFCRMTTIPFNFSIAHNVEGRTLYVVHPRNQAEMAGFYARYHASITYHTSQSEFSIRRPISVSRFAYFKDRLHEQRLEVIAAGVEQYDKEYEQLGSYFVYKNYRNIHQFFESYKYHRCEKKYDAMVQIDISRCFDSIYTHSIVWATIGKAQTKFDLGDIRGIFADRFDSIMQGLNHGETNGIVIGPEFSRIFSEIILQSVDVSLQRELKKERLIHKRHYEIFRYVDDYFVFYNEIATEARIVDKLQRALRGMKLSINASKIRSYKKPIITEITIAKDRVSTLLNAEMDPRSEQIILPDGVVQEKFVFDLNANRLIIRYKAAIKESQVDYANLLNYTFAIVEAKLNKAFVAYAKSGDLEIHKRRLISALLGTMEFLFFAYSASPKVNHTIRMCRIISTAVDFLRRDSIAYDQKHLFFKYVHDNIIQQLDKNRITSFREVESLYLLISLSVIGREYWLPEGKLVQYFGIGVDDAGEYFRSEHLSHFSITVLLSYIKNKLRYKKLRSFIEGHVLAKLTYKKVHCPNDAEALILLLDMVVCPYIDNATKKAIASIFDIDAGQLALIMSANEWWFTAWGEKFDLGKELEAKRSREVY